MTARTLPEVVNAWYTTQVVCPNFEYAQEFTFSSATEGAIALLPNFILFDIFELVWAGESFPSERSYRDSDEQCTTRAILRVCKYWHAICQPLLYRNVNLFVGWSDRHNRSRRALYYMLDKNPRVRSYTRIVSIWISRSLSATFSKTDDFEIATLLRWWRPNLRQVSIVGSIQRLESCSILFQLSKIPLKVLKLSVDHPGISLSFFLKYFQYSVVKQMHLDQLSWTEDRDDPVPHAQQRSSYRGELLSDEETHLPHERQFTADLKRLSLLGPNLSPNALIIFFKWPRALEAIYMHCLMHSSCARLYTTEAVGRLLVLQAHSLKSVSIGFLYNENRHDLNATTVPDVSSFVELENLTLSYANVFKTPAGAARSRLAAPKLRRLIIDFSTEDQHDIGVESANAEVKDWLLDFANAWQVTSTKHNLERIHLNFNPDLPTYDVDEMRRMPWPWRHLHAAREQMKPYLQLTWSGTIQSELDWLEMVNGLETMSDDESSTKSDEGWSDEEQSQSGVNEASSHNFFELNHDPSQHRICRLLQLNVQCVH